MGLSQKDTFKSTADMRNGHAATHPPFKWSQTAPAKQISRLCAGFWDRCDFTNQTPQKKSVLKANLSSNPPPGRQKDSSLSAVQPKIRITWLHTLTWLNDVWSGVTPNRSHPAICSASRRCTKAALADTLHDTQTHGADSFSLSCVLQIRAPY